ncbi:hypothetical protein OC861_006052 [Tilletia horrida]|nr:hypothetical protein OC861_006052 [Tilletia horrida]
MSKPHQPPTFLVPGEDNSAPGPSRLAHTHSHRDIHDADVGANDAGFGFYSSEAAEPSHPGRRHLRSVSASGPSLAQHHVASPVRRAITDSVDSTDPRAREIASAPRRTFFSRSGTAQSATKTKSTTTAKHHFGLLDAIRNDLKADREEEVIEGKELAEVRQGGTGEKAFIKGSIPHADADLEAQRLASRDTVSDDTALDPRSPSSKAETTTEKDHDPNLVGWDSPDDLANPRNWSTKKKWTVTTLVSLYTLLSPLSSSMIAPALPILQQDFHVSSQVESELMLSTFILAYAVGPLVLSGLSEMYGRLPVLQSMNLVLIVFTMASGLSQTSAQMTIFRFFAGLGGSAPLTIGSGVISDLYQPEQRGKAMAVYSLAPLLGPCVGPIAAGWIVQSGTSWRWIFWSVLIASGIVAAVGFLTISETYAPVILAKKRNKLIKETGNQDLYTIFDVQKKESFAQRLRRNVVRPFVFMTTQPIVMALSMYMMVVYGVLYILLSVVDTTFRTTYNEGPGIASLHYIALGLGFTTGGQIGGRLVDKVYRILKKRNNGVGKPEFKIPFMCVASPFVPMGLLIYGWSIHYAVHWIVPDIGLFFFGLGMMSSFLSTQNYLVDTYQLFAASAVGAAVFLRSLAGFALPLASPALYSKLGQGWGNSVLALISAVLGIPAPLLLWHFGPFLRAKSKYATDPN